MATHRGSNHQGAQTPHGLTAFAVAPPGFEDLVAAELRGMDLAGVNELAGGVEFLGGWSGVYRANLFSRVASRVLVRVSRFAATTFPQLAAGFARVPWDEWLPVGCAVELRVTCRKSRLYHSGRVRQELAGVLAAAVRAGEVPVGEGGFRLQVRLERDLVQVSLDTSGEHLHRRGYRDHTGPAPLRENLAAGLLARAGWNGREPLLDPCCGSGTIPVEAALLAAGVAPGARRRFAFQDLPSFDQSSWEEEHARSGGARSRAGSIYASDRDPAALQLAARAARQAGVAESVQVACAEIDELAPFAACGLLVANPPYGMRLRGGLAAYRALGRALRGALRGWRWAVVVPGDDSREALGLRPSASYPFRNGGMRLRFEMGPALGG